MRNAIIIGLIFLILILGGGWFYLMVHGTPKSVADVTSNLFGQASDAPPMAGGDATDTPTATPDDIAPVTQELAKLTSRSVAGATFATGSTEGVVRFMEKGTGNIYDISLATGVETRVSNTTIVGAVAAYWAESGMRVAVTTEQNGHRGNTSFGALAKSDDGSVVLTLDDLSLPPIENIAWDEAGDTVYFTEDDGTGGSVATKYDFKQKKESGLFQIPFSENIVIWDTTGRTDTYVYTKAALGYMGYLYRVTPKGDLQFVEKGNGLTAFRNANNALIINTIDDIRTGSYIMTNGGDRLSLNIETDALKCGGVSTTWCGATAAAQHKMFPIDWYQGVSSYADQLWRIDTETGSAVQIADPEALAREAIDVTDLMVADNGQVIFRNKKDDALWLFNPPEE